MPIILATWEAEIGRITAQGQPEVNSSQDPISKKLAEQNELEVWPKW
jgi:hypothetical protein